MSLKSSSFISSPDEICGLTGQPIGPALAGRPSAHEPGRDGVFEADQGPAAKEATAAQFQQIRFDNTCMTTS